MSPKGTDGTTTDVARRTQAPGRQVDDSERDLRFRQMAESIEQVFWMSDPETTEILYVSPAYEKIWGRSCQSVYDEPRSFLEGIHPEDRPGVLHALEQQARTGEFEHEYRVLRPDGSIRWVRDRSFAIRDEEGRIHRVAGVVEDVTERRRIQEEHSRLARAVEQAAESIVITDLEGNILYVNPSYERVTGYSRGEVLGKNPRILKSGRHDAEHYRKMWDTLTRGEVWKGTFVNRRRDGTLFEEEAVISALRDAHGKAVNYVAVKHDVTRQRETERQLLQAQKMEAIGQLAGGLAHDFNNLLTIINGFGALTLESMAPSDPRREQLEQIVEAGNRAAALTRQLLAFSRRQIMEPVDLDLNAVVSDIEKMLRRLIGENVSLVLDLAGEPMGAKADAGQIEQVIMNLAVNARDAMPDGGVLTLRTARVRSGPGPQPAVCAPYGPTAPPPGDHVMLEVSDTGIGMIEEIQARVFEPFYTTKGRGKGTGLGLSTCFGIVKQSGGHLTFESRPGKGTSFRVYLPHVLAGRKAVPLKRPARVHPEGHETILLVEDDDGVRGFAARVLRGLGYTIVEAANGEEGLRLAREWDGKIDLLLTDVIMPIVGGRELADRVQDRSPRVRVLFSSGHTDEAIDHQGRLDPGVALLKKPYSPEALACKVREILDCARMQAEPGAD